MRSRSESGRRVGSGEGGALGRILYKKVGRGSGAGMFADGPRDVAEAAFVLTGSVECAKLG